MIKVKAIVMRAIHLCGDDKGEGNVDDGVDPQHSERFSDTGDFVLK